MLIVVAIIVAQACWLAFLAGRGWFYGDDLSYMSDAAGRRLDWGYLSEPLNDHFVPGVRLYFWLQQRVIGLDYGVTLVFRMILQAAATLALYRLLLLLVGRRRGVLAALTWYALTPLLMPGFLWLTTSVHLLSAQLLVLGAITWHVRYTVTGRLGFAVAGALALLGAVAFWEMTAITAAILPILTLGYLVDGSPRERVAALLRRWPGWAVLTAGMVLWLSVFLAGPYGGSAHRVSVGRALHLLRVGWFDAVSPALIGGPWHWFWVANVYYPVSAPPLPVIVVAQVCVVAVVLLGWQRTGRRSLIAWSMPALSFVSGTVLIAVGRAWFYGDLTPKSFNYIHVLAVPVALAGALAVLPSSTADIATRVRHGVPARALVLPPPVGRIAGTWLAVLLLASSIVSAVAFSNRWALNPTRPYVETLTRSIHQAGPDVNLYDTSVSQRVLPFLANGRHVSDLLRLAGVRARFQDQGSDPMIVTEDGSLAPASMFPVATGIQQPKTVCTRYLRGSGQWRIGLDRTVTPNEYFLEVSYLQQIPSVVDIWLVDDSGRRIVPVHGSRVELTGRLANLELRLPFGAPVGVVVSSHSEATNVCVGSVIVGVPVSRAGR